MILGKITKNDIGNIRNKAKRGCTLEEVCSLYGYGSDTAKFEDDLNNIFKFEVKKKGNSTGSQIMKKLQSNSETKKRSQQNRAKRSRKNDAAINFEALPDEGSAVYNPNAKNGKDAFEKTDFDSKIDVAEKSENEKASEKSDIKVEKPESEQQGTETEVIDSEKQEAETAEAKSKQQETETAEAKSKHQETETAEAKSKQQKAEKEETKSKQQKAKTEEIKSKQQQTETAVTEPEKKKTKTEGTKSKNQKNEAESKKNFSDDEILEKLKEERAEKAKHAQELEKRKKEIDSTLMEFVDQISNSKEILNQLKAEYEKLKELIPKFNSAKQESNSVNREIVDAKIELLDIEKAIQLLNPVKLVFSGSLPDGDYIDATTIKKVSDEEINELMVQMLSDVTMYKLVESQTIQVLKSFAEIIAKANKVKGENERVNLYFEDDKSEVIQLVKQFGELHQKTSIKVIITKWLLHNLKDQHNAGLF